MKDIIINQDFERGVFPAPLINEPAPPFKANSTIGVVDFPKDYKGKWVMLFSYNDDYCPVCTSELLEVYKDREKYKEAGLEIVAFSPDSLLTHFAWLEDVSKINFEDYKNTQAYFPFVSDTNREIAKKYGLLDNSGGGTSTIRGSFLIDPSGKIRASSQYPIAVGRARDEIIRTYQAVRKTTEEDVNTPANWQPGNDLLITTPKDIEDVYTRRESSKGFFCPTWFYCFKRDNNNNNEEKKVETLTRDRPINKPFNNGLFTRKF